LPSLPRDNILPLPPLAIFFALVPRPKARSCATWPLPGPRRHDFADFEAISQTPPPSTPSFVQIGFAVLPSPTRLAAAKPPSAAACLRTGAASDGSPPTIASSSGHALAESPVFTSRCCKLVNDHVSILFGSTGRRHRLPNLYAMTLSHSRTLECPAFFVPVKERHWTRSDMGRGKKYQPEQVVHLLRQI
jgi:hypothetical protein